MTPPYADALLAAPPASAGTSSRHRRKDSSRHVLAFALAVSLALHLAMTAWPVDLSTVPDAEPLQATITELPPPPAPAPAPVVRKPRPKRALPPPVAAPEPSPVVADETPAPSAAAEPPPAETAVAPEPEVPPVASVESPPIAPDAPPKELPPRLDLAYKVYLGTQGFMIGDATYRFEHTGNQYRITTVGQARGLAALLIRGQGRIESHGLITRNGLQPQEFSVERGSKDRREVATFDWESGIVTLHEQKIAPLELETYDPLALMWQYYFSPPVGDQLSFSIATTRRVFRYTITKESHETIDWPQGQIDTELWHRKSDDGKVDSYIWLAPSLHYVPVKLRLVATDRGTVEAILDSIRIDEPLAAQ